MNEIYIAQIEVQKYKNFWSISRIQFIHARTSVVKQSHRGICNDQHLILFWKWGV